MTLAFRPNTKLDILRPSAPDEHGARTLAQVISRTQARASFSKNSVVTGEGILKGTDGTIELQADVAILEGDIVQFIPRRGGDPNYRVESVVSERGYGLYAVSRPDLVQVNQVALVEHG